MSDSKYIDSDIVKVHKSGEKRTEKNLLATLFWGDKVNVIGKEGNSWKLDFTKREWDKETKKYIWKKYDASISSKVKFREIPLLKVRFVDVGQGDASIIESPKGKIIILDGGEEDHLKNYMSASWAYLLKDKSLDCEAVIVTHGDADHFSGLTKLVNATRGGNKPMIKVKRVFHSGIIKGPNNLSNEKIFGKSKTIDGKLYITELEDDIRSVPDNRLNVPFKGWKKALVDATNQFPDLVINKVQQGDDAVFDFLENEDLHIQVLGPIVEKHNQKPVLPYLHAENSKSYSVSHTINGHSIVLKLTYGNVRFLFGADLNAESQTNLLEFARKENLSLSSEILKVPHHGSADFNPAMLEAVRPVVSVISSGDENEAKEYIHPRAGLVGALGKYSRATVEKPLIYVTEMVAFFKKIGHVKMYTITPSGKVSTKPIEHKNVYVKKMFGIVHIRTDGQRVLVATHSGKPGQKESYSFNVDNTGNINFAKSTKVL